MQRQTPNPALRQLDALVGDWEMQASVGVQPLGRARAQFEWLEGGAFLIQLSGISQADQSNFPGFLSGSMAS